MAFPTLTFPLQVDFGQTIYWIDDAGPFQYGEAVTAFFAGELTADGVGDELLLMRQLEDCLQAFGEHLQPYVLDRSYDPSARARVMLQSDECAAQFSVCFTYHPVENDTVAMVERCTFQCLWDFLYVELCRAIRVGNAPRECRLCRRWFLHVQGEKFLYCENVAPGETEKTCREVGARASFEQKVRSDDVWKFYKRAYKKYYARVMKGNMTRDEFNAWVEHAAAERDFTMELLLNARSEDERAEITEQLRQKLNEK